MISITDALAPLIGYASVCLGYGAVSPTHIGYGAVSPTHIGYVVQRL